MKITNKIILTFISLFFISCTDNSNNGKITCKSEIRGGFDIGSGSTKLQIAKVSSCDNGEINIEKVYYKKNSSVKYAQDLEDSKSNNLSQQIIDDGFKAMSQMKNEALKNLKEQCGESCKVTSWRGIMTEAFRNAKNWEKARTELTKIADGLIIKRLSQKEEALYGYYPIVKLKGFNSQNTVVWDMGGGSTQITAFNTSFNTKQFSQNGAKVIETPLGSSTFSEFLKETIKINGKKANLPKTFNPIHKFSYLESKSKEHIMNKINHSVQKDQEIKDKFNTLFVNNKKYYVIGGLLSISVPEILSDKKPNYKVIHYADIKDISGVVPIHKKDVEDSYNAIKNLDDNALLVLADKLKMNKNYFQTMASNLLMVRKYMESNLNINEIYPIHIDGTDTIMISPESANENYWKIDKITAK